MARLVFALATRQKRTDQKTGGYWARGNSDGSGAVEQVKPIPHTRTLPAFFRVMEWDDKLKKKVPKRVGYCPDEQSIYVDEWVGFEGQDLKHKIRKAQKIKFSQGYCVVDDEKEPLKAELLQKIDINGSKVGRDESVKPKFFELNKEKDAKKILDAEKKKTLEIASFWSTPIEKLQAVANAIGIITQPDSLVWVHKLYRWAENHVDEYSKQLKNPDLDYLDTVTKAENLGIIKFDENTWFISYGNGDVPQPILKVSPLKKQHVELANKLINDPPLERAIVNSIAEKEGKVSRKIGEAMQDVNMDEIDSIALIDLAVTHKVLEYHQGKGYEVLTTGLKIPNSRSKAGAAEAIDADPILREAIIKELNSI